MPRAWFLADKPTQPSHSSSFSSPSPIASGTPPLPPALLWSPSGLCCVYPHVASWGMGFPWAGTRQSHPRAELAAPTASRRSINTRVTRSLGTRRREGLRGKRTARGAWRSRDLLQAPKLRGRGTVGKRIWLKVSNSPKRKRHLATESCPESGRSLWPFPATEVVALESIRVKIEHFQWQTSSRGKGGPKASTWKNSFLATWPPSLPATWSSGHLATWSLSHLVTWSPGHPVYWPPGHPATQPPGHPASRPPGYLATWSPGHLATWPPGHSVTWSPSHLVSQPPGHWSPTQLATWSPSRLATRSPGHPIT